MYLVSLCGLIVEAPAISLHFIIFLKYSCSLLTWGKFLQWAKENDISLSLYLFLSGKYIESFVLLNLAAAVGIEILYTTPDNIPHNIEIERERERARLQT